MVPRYVYALAWLSNYDGFPPVVHQLCAGCALGPGLGVLPGPPVFVLSGLQTAALSPVVTEWLIMLQKVTY